jgi:hypothetical protein
MVMVVAIAALSERKGDDISLEITVFVDEGVGAWIGQGRRNHENDIRASTFKLQGWDGAFSFYSRLNTDAADILGRFFCNSAHSTARTRPIVSILCGTAFDFCLPLVGKS